MCYMSSRSRRRRAFGQASKPPWRPVLTGSGTGSPPHPEICYNLNTMTEPQNHLKLVDPSTNPLDDAEFIPLPYYPWEVRPSHLPLDVEEVATSLYLSQGIIGRAAERLKVEPLKVVRAIARSARLTRLHAELASLLNDKVHEEYVRAFEATDDRRREWAASKLSQTKQFQNHPLAPYNSAPAQLSGPNASGPMRIVISWEEAAGPLIEPQPGD